MVASFCWNTRKSMFCFYYDDGYRSRRNFVSRKSMAFEVFWDLRGSHQKCTGVSPCGCTSCDPYFRPHSYLAGNGMHAVFENCTMYLQYSMQKPDTSQESRVKDVTHDLGTLCDIASLYTHYLVSLSNNQCYTVVPLACPLLRWSFWYSFSLLFIVFVKCL